MADTTPATPALAACPCCGGVAHLTKGYATENVWDHGTFHRVFCGTCQLRQLFYRTPEEAIAAWNRRAAAPLAPAGWIPVTERLPEVGREVLMWVSAEVRGESDDGREVGHDVSQVAMGSCLAGLGGPYLSCYVSPFADFEHITHWQPLPPPPGAVHPSPDHPQADAWQYRRYYTGDDAGWGLWQSCTAEEAARFQQRSDIQVRALYAVHPSPSKSKQESDDGR